MVSAPVCGRSGTLNSLSVAPAALKVFSSEDGLYTVLSLCCIWLKLVVFVTLAQLCVCKKEFVNAKKYHPMRHGLAIQYFLLFFIESLFCMQLI